MNEYPYAEGDRLVEPNTYFYTPSVGTGMLEAWIASRAAVAALLPEPAAAPAYPEGPLPSLGEAVDTRSLLLRLGGCLLAVAETSEAVRHLDRIAKKFEVVKRLHPAYRPDFKPVDAEDYRDMGLYVLAAEVLLLAYSRTRTLPYLNAAMKMLDTLCSRRLELDASDGARVSGLIARERELVETLRGARP